MQEPLRAVSSYTQLLAKRYTGKLDADADEFIGYVVGGVSQMQRLINDLLEYSRVGAADARSGPIDCTKAYDAAHANLRAQIEESGAAVTSDTLPIVTADESQLIQLFQNLIGNAINTAATSRRGFTSPPCRATVSGSSGSATAVSGSTRSMASKSSKCSSDCTPPPSTPEQARASRSARRSWNVGAAESGSNRRLGWGRNSASPFRTEGARLMASANAGTPIEILLVEDSPGDVRLTKEGFYATGLRNTLHVVQDGVEAMAFLRREDVYADAPAPDLILLDLNLPRKSGREVLAEIKQDPALKRIPGGRADDIGRRGRHSRGLWSSRELLHHQAVRSRSVYPNCEID